MSSKRTRAAFESDGPPSHAPYALYGTPLPAYDSEARDDGSYVPVWKQEVTDERGRKRLHGAFTGGYSAGYFNTVGSKEGWSPSTFVSSRANRAGVSKDDSGKQRQNLRPEDFMDEEDLAEQAEAQQLETQKSFAGLGSASKDGSAGKGMFSDLFKTSGETMGTKLLQRMGWRQGQGVGPKVKRRAEGDKTGEIHAFAPENTRMITFSKKTDRKGLGFAGETSLDAGEKGEDDDDSDPDARILSANRAKLPVKPRKVKKSSFGVGVLNDTGSDDEDPYAIGPPINYTRIIGADKKKRKGGLVASTTVQRPTLTPGNRKATQRPPAASSTLVGFRRCHDGRLPLEGFLLSTRPLNAPTDPQYPPPEVPIGWKPSRRATKFDVETISPFQSTSEAAKTSSLDAKARATLLGEKALPGKSVFDFLKPSAREGLVSASGRADLPQAKSESAPADFKPGTSTADPKTLWDLVPPLDPATAAAALQRGKSGWMPYSEDPAKRDRYAAFLILRAGADINAALPTRPPGQSAEDWAKELREFAQAAQVFRPISGLMATRFTTSTSAAPKLASDAPDKAPEPVKKAGDPAEEAARAGMFGQLTRRSYPFYPTRLLCKRFNVKPPANSGVDPAKDGGEEKSTLVGRGELERMMMHANVQMGGKGAAGGGPKGGSGEDGMQGGGVPERTAVDVERNEALEGQRAGREVFRSVFEE